MVNKNAYLLLILILFFRGLQPISTNAADNESSWRIARDSKSDIKTAGFWGYPYPFTETEPPLPEYLQTPVQVPTPSMDKGVVTGSLRNLDGGEPLQFQTLFLGQKVYLTPAPGYTYHIFQNTSPKTTSDINGDFAFGDVPEGEYIVMVWTPFGAYVIMENGTELMVKVKPGKTLELGELDAVDVMKHTETP